MHEDDAIKFLINYLRAPPATEYSNYGYDVYMFNVMVTYLEKTEGGQRLGGVGDPRIQEISPYFYAAAWELCRRGILRPRIKRSGEQVTDAGSGGDGYSITPFGRKWLDEANRDDFVPTEPERFGQMLEPFQQRFGPGFQQRAQEAVRCYGAHAYLACCVMCGAAAESILLATAVAKVGDEDDVLRMYETSRGRQRIENKLIGQAPEPVKRQFRGHTELLNYWRDDAAHGKLSPIDDNGAYTSLAMLLRLANFVVDQWEDLTREREAA